jgi:hypothetical protein
MKIYMLIEGENFTASVGNDICIQESIDHNMLKAIVKTVNTHEQEFQNRKPAWDYMQNAMEQTKETLKQEK